MYDPGTTTFMIMSCALVLMMGPALAIVLRRPFKKKERSKHHAHVRDAEGCSGLSLGSSR